jgi:hypothetical protein
MVKGGVNMAGSPNKKTPFSDISHLGPDAISFALSLRPEEDDKNNIFKDLTEEEAAILGETAPASRRPCKNKSCVETETTQKLAILKRVQNFREKNVLQTKLEELDIEVNELVERRDEIAAENLSLGQTASVLIPKRVSLEKEFKKVQSERRHLSERLKSLHTFQNKLKAKVEEKKDDEAEEVTRHLSMQFGSTGDNSEDAPLIIIPQTHGPHKHSGVYEFQAAINEKGWSCCFNTDRHAEGCQDDQSIGVRTTLGQKHPSFYRPMSAFQPPVDLLLMPWKRTSQGRLANPPVWPPKSRPATSDKHLVTMSGAAAGEGAVFTEGCNTIRPLAVSNPARSFRGNTAGVPGSSSHLLADSAAELYHFHDANCGCGTAKKLSRYQSQRNKTKLSKTLTSGLLFQKIHAKEHRLRPHSTRNVGHAMKDNRYSDLPRANRALTMFTGTHLKTSSTVPPLHNTLF